MVKHVKINDIFTLNNLAITIEVKGAKQWIQRNLRNLGR
jgi:hypothetical protein